MKKPSVNKLNYKKIDLQSSFIGSYKRDFSKRRTLYQLLNKIKRDQGDQDDSDESNAGDVSEE